MATTDAGVMWQDEQDEEADSDGIDQPVRPAVDVVTKLLLTFTALKVGGAAVKVATQLDSPGASTGTVPLAFVVLQIVAFGGAGAVS